VPCPPQPPPPELKLAGYVLAGGRSSRMGRDKVLLQLAGRPLIHHAVTKLRRICAEVHILAGPEPAAQPAASTPTAARASTLAVHAPLVYDLHPNYGPLAGIEAALAHSPHPWNLILPVDMPLLPTAFLNAWVRKAIGRSPVRIALFELGGRIQAMPLLIHRDVGAYLSRAIERGEYTLLAALEGAAAESGVAPDISVLSADEWEPWFANLNTPEDLAAAEEHADALDSL
jgi:molybdopterin-guanine dinucleotide biosynthesis protein A